MKIPNPINFVVALFVLIYTAWYLRILPTIKEGAVGWASEDLEYGAGYNVVDGFSFVLMGDKEAVARHATRRFANHRASYRIYKQMLDDAIDAYLEAGYGKH